MEQMDKKIKDVEGNIVTRDIAARNRWSISKNCLMMMEERQS